ncbi:hypothetical protein LSAT2_007524, partial [Lamellibrachia satsuma]
HIPKTSFSVCVVTTHDTTVILLPADLTTKKIVYHRLDLQPNKTPLCRIGAKLGTRETPVAKFTGTGFLKPYLYLNRIENAETVHIYEQFVAGIATSNPNLRAEVRNAAKLTEHIDDFWKSNTYPYWRYVCTRYGICKVYPGVVLPKNYDHTTRRWFLSAEANERDLVLAPPYVDAFGTGVVLTLCKTLVQNRF